MEALEVWHAERIVKPIKLASFEEMRAEHRVADVARLPRARNSRYTAALPLMWIEGEDLLGGGAVWVPFELVSANYTLPLPPGSGCFQANTNGLASGNHRLEAVSHGLCEVVERDSRTLWKHRTPAAKSANGDRSGQRGRCRVRTRDQPVPVGEPGGAYLGHDDGRRHCEFRLPVRGVRRGRCGSRVRLGLPSCAAHRAAARAHRSRAGAKYLHCGGTRRLFPASVHTVRRGPGAKRSAGACWNHLNLNAYTRTCRASSRSRFEGDLRWMLARLRAAGIEQVIAVDLTREAIGVPVVAGDRARTRGSDERCRR